jgi:hypothetical protein
VDDQDEDSVENKEDKECGQLWPCIFFFFFFKVHQQEITTNKNIGLDNPTKSPELTSSVVVNRN